MLSNLQILTIAGLFWGSLAMCGVLIFGCFALIDGYCAREFKANKKITDKI